ncbi:hypothetical protein D3C79_670930 [compost metagenome]
MPTRSIIKLWATSGLFIDKLTDTTCFKSSAPLLLLSSQRWPSCTQGIGGPARMPWLSGELAVSGTTTVCAGPAGRSIRLVRRLPSLLSTVTSTVSGQSIPLCRRKVMAVAADQSQAPACGLKRRLGRCTGLNTTRRNTSPSAVCSALYCGKLASSVTTLTTAAGRTKLNSVCCPASSGVLNNSAKTAGKVRRIIGLELSLRALAGLELRHRQRPGAMIPGGQEISRRNGGKALRIALP